MRKAVLLLVVVLLATIIEAQSDRFAYAVTDVQKEGTNWSFLRKLNLQNGEYSKVLLDGNDISLLAYDAVSKKQFEAPLSDSRYSANINAAFATGVAAMAYDKRNDRLYYTPMFIDQLRYIDLKSMKVFYLTDQSLTGMPQKSSDQGNIVTRMVIASDGNGYAMTNDATHLIKFTTGKKIVISDLGTLVDDPGNTTVSVHNSCSSFGGDIIADDDNNLYAFSARNHVFKINLETRVATHLGVISGLPGTFTVNGAAVNENNKIIVGSAMEASSYFIVDPKTWAASPYTISGTVWHSSDLANSNLLVSGNKPKGSAPELLTRSVIGDNRIHVYPNPVIDNKFFVQFNQLEEGNYTVQLMDVMGRQVSQKLVAVSGDNQTQDININSAAARGIYMIKVTDHNNKSVFSTKIVVQ